MPPARDDAVELREGVEFVVGRPRIQPARQQHRAEESVLGATADSGDLRAPEALVEAGVVGDQLRPPHELESLG